MLLDANSINEPKFSLRNWSSALQFEYETQMASFYPHDFTALILTR
jgi:hypothetical protein